MSMQAQIPDTIRKPSERCGCHGVPWEHAWEGHGLGSWHRIQRIVIESYSARTKVLPRAENVHFHILAILGFLGLWPCVN